MELSNQTTYLAENTSSDVVGIIKDYDQIRDLKNKHGQDQKKTKLVITDGRSNVNVTFWDKFGESFDKSMKNPLDKPVIIILSGCKVGKWNGEVDLSNSYATKVYLNYKHHSVVHLWKLLANEEFAKKALGKNNVKTIQKINVDELKKLGKNAIESCNRYVPYPDQKFRFHVIAEDMTGKVQVVLGDMEARTIIGKRCLHLADECLTESNIQMFTEEGLPKTLLSIVDKDYSLVIQVREMNVVNNFNVYWANNICKGFVGLPGATNQTVNAKDAQTSQPTTSTYNAGGLSDIDLASN
ncbi:hypothetical protein DCAR_0934119 [Daucus carota subsp. sativus]|uniref:Replication protein A OB domain-containing protein n=1 Tax=Daucus carota subsp. sativus TaxID=79200 RepID=A0AAF1BCG9_DAUCS|nr:hypothetical protein DCAR_0934119 [Daucus carota subsp. sativus]